MIIREALDSDNPGLLRLTSMNPMSGNISVRIDRNPDFFHLLNLRGKSKVFVAEDGNQIVGSFSAVEEICYANGKPETCWYLCDMKVSQSFRGSVIAHRMVLKMKEFLCQEDAGIITCTAALGNTRVMPFFLGRLGIPDFVVIGNINVYQIIPKKFRKKASKYRIDETIETGVSLSLCNKLMEKYRFSPVYSTKSLEGAMLVGAWEGATLRAVVGLADMSGAKQNVLIRLPLSLQLVVRLAAFVRKIYPLAYLPKMNENIKMLYIKLLAFEPGHEEAMRLLIREARRISFNRRYTFLTVGIDKDDPATKLFRNVRKFTFRSLLMMGHMKGDMELVMQIKSGVSFEDFSLV